MRASSLLLVATVLLLFIGWVKAVRDAARARYIDDPPMQKRLVAQAMALFSIVVVLELIAGLSGVFSRFDSFPPPFAAFFVVNVLILPVFVAFSRFGSLLAASLAPRVLAGAQSFRILAELVIFAAVKEGIAPVQMSFEGYNPDIITGVAAVLLYFLGKKRRDSPWYLAFNIWGVFALAVIGFIAITSMPTPLRLFMNEPSNVWVTTAPYTLLPGVLVSAALALHLIYFRSRSRLKRAI